MKFASMKVLCSVGRPDLPETRRSRSITHSSSAVSCTVIPPLPDIKATRGGFDLLVCFHFANPDLFHSQSLHRVQNPKPKVTIARIRFDMSLALSKQMKDIDDPKAVRPDMDGSSHSGGMMKGKGQSIEFCSESSLTKSRQVSRPKDATNVESPRISKRGRNDRTPGSNTDVGMGLPKT